MIRIVSRDSESSRVEMGWDLDRKRKKKRNRTVSILAKKSKGPIQEKREIARKKKTKQGG